MKEFSHLDAKGKLEAEKLIEANDRMNTLVNKKYNGLDLSKVEDLKTTLNIAKFSYKNRIENCNKFYDLIKRSVDKKLSEGTLSQVEADVFHIKLGKRNQEKETFVKFINDHLKTMEDKLNKVQKNKFEFLESSIKGPVSNIERKPSLEGLSETFSSLADSGVGKISVSEEIVSVLLEICDLFS
jgi:hypothetical protein